MRNVLIAAGNSENPDLAGHIISHLGDASPLVRGAAVWALSQLLDNTAFQNLKSVHMAEERNDSVCNEWEMKEADA